MLRLRNLIMWITLMAFVQVNGQDEPLQLSNYWQIGFGLGELPMGGSFKPSISLGYHFNEKVYAGIIYQFRDEISRNEASFNAGSTELEGLLSSFETVARRFMLQVRITPVKHGPYISTGFVYNGRDTEIMRFDDRSRNLSGELFDGTIEIHQSRPAGWGVALGLGYQYNFRNGFSAGFEWTPAWGQYPEPVYQFAGSAELSAEAREELQLKMDEGFRGSVTNLYKIFHIGVAYRFQ